LDNVQNRSSHRKDPIRHPRKNIQTGIAAFMIHDNLDADTAAYVWGIVGEIEPVYACEAVVAEAHAYKVGGGMKQSFDPEFAYEYMANQLGNLTALGVISEEDGKEILGYVCRRQISHDVTALYEYYIESYARLHR